VQSVNASTFMVYPVSGGGPLPLLHRREHRSHARASGRRRMARFDAKAAPGGW
jgi:hypothetical protein